MSNIKSILNGGPITQNSSQPLTRRLLIIGTAVDGPINEPVRVTSSSQIASLFGPAKYTQHYLNTSDANPGTPNGATIPLDVKIALDSGCKDIYVVRATGEYATAATAFSSKLDIRSKYPGYIYNQVRLVSSVSSATATVTLVQPSNKGGNQSYTFYNTHNLEQVIETINNDPRNNTIRIDPNTFPAELSSSATSLSGTATLSGGENGCVGKGGDIENNCISYATYLTTDDTGTFDVIHGLRFEYDVAVMGGIYLDSEVEDGDPSKSIGYSFAEFLELCSRDARPCLGYISVRPPNIQDRADWISYYNNNLASTTTGFYNETLGWTKAGGFMYDGFRVNLNSNETLDLGARLGITVDEAVFGHSDVPDYVGGVAVAVAALRTTVPGHESITRKTLVAPKYFLSNIPGNYAEALANGVGFSPDNDLSGRGAYIVLQRDYATPSTQRFILEECSAAFRESVFRIHQVVYLMNNIQSDIAFILKPYIGLPASQGIQFTMATDVKNVLDGWAAQGAFRGGQGTGYRFEFYQNESDTYIGQIRLDVTTIPATTLQKIVQTMNVTNG